MKSKLILCATILAAASVSRAAYTPVAIQSGSYNADVIVEVNAGPRLDLATSATVDNGTNNRANTWFEIGFDTNNPANGLPAAGSTFAAVDDAPIPLPWHRATRPPTELRLIPWSPAALSR